MTNKVNSIISQLELAPHPEGGYFKRTYSSKFTSDSFNIDNRPITSMIYYLLKSGDKSKFHRLKSDEIWLFHSGCSINIHVITDDGKYKLINIGNDNVLNLQAIVPANSWFAAEPSTDNSYCLCSCVVNPGFDFSEFELIRKDKMLLLFPDYKDLICKFC